MSDNLQNFVIDGRSYIPHPPIYIVNVYNVMLWVLGPTALLVYLYSTLVLVLHFTCTAHLYLLYKALMYILSLRNIIQSSNISNMISKPLL